MRRRHAWILNSVSRWIRQHRSRREIVSLGGKKGARNAVWWRNKTEIVQREVRVWKSGERFIHSSFTKNWIWIFCKCTFFLFFLKVSIWSEQFFFFSLLYSWCFFKHDQTEECILTLQTCRHLTNTFTFSLQNCPRCLKMAPESCGSYYGNKGRNQVT